MKTSLLIFFFTTILLAQEKEIGNTIDQWHQAAAQAKFEQYFSIMDENSIFIGTDATEHWSKNQFKAFAKPFFDKGKAWSFTAIERHIYVSKDKKMAWFDELLNTQMKICRGSGVLIKVGKDWKIKHYTLSMTIPNDNVDAVIAIKSGLENPLIEKLQTSYNTTK